MKQLNGNPLLIFQSAITMKVYLYVIIYCIKKIYDKNNFLLYTKHNDFFTSVYNAPS